jgi:hypothetical protein
VLYWPKDQEREIIIVETIDVGGIYDSWREFKDTLERMAKLKGSPVCGIETLFFFLSLEV